MVPLYARPRAGIRILRPYKVPVRPFSTVASEFQHAVPPKFRLDHLDLTANEPRVPCYSLATIENISNPTPTVKLLRLRTLRGTEAIESFESISAVADGWTSGDSVDRGKVHIDFDNPFQYKAGQWVDFAIPSVPVVGGYSIVSFPFKEEGHVPDTACTLFEKDIRCAKLPYFDLAVKIGRHPPAAWVHSEARVNAIVAVRPGGSFSLANIHAIHPVTGKPRYNHVVLIAGGVGINPLYSMLLSLSWEYIRDSHSCPNSSSESASGGRSPHRITLIYSCRNREEVLFVEQLQKLYSNVLGGLLRVHITLTREPDEVQGNELHNSPGEEGSTSSQDLWGPDRYHRGRIDEDLIARAICEDSLEGPADSNGASLINSSHVDSTGVIICGPPVMTDSIVSVCKSIGVPEEDIHFEKWW